MAWPSGREPAFYDSMPSRYRQLFRGPTVSEHAAIVARRGTAPAYAEIWRSLPQGGVIACIVADDRPGVLSCLGTALAAQSIDILSAQVYARRNRQGAEVVDFFWLRRDDAIASSLVETDLARVADLLGGLITGELRVDGRPLAGRHAASPEAATLVRFDEPTDAGPATLSLETIEHPGLFRAVTSALLRANVRIIGSKRTPGPGSHVVHRFSISEVNGKAPDQYRRGLLQAEILRVLEPVVRGSPIASHAGEESGGADYGLKN